MNQETIDYASLIPYKISEIVTLINEKKIPDFTNAVKYLYQSELYNHLADETTKLWHLSAEKLYDILENEKENNEFQFPDFV